MTSPLNPNAFRAQEIQRLTKENAALHEEIEGLRKFVGSLDNLYNASDNFKDDSKLFSFLRGTLHTAMTILNAPDGSLALLDEDTQELVFVIVVGELSSELTNQRIGLDKGVAGWVVRNAKATLVRDVRRDPRFYSGLDDRFSFHTQSTNIPINYLWGGGRMGGFSCPFIFFSTSISETRMLGETAETGTQPDSAPQVPLKIP